MTLLYILFAIVTVACLAFVSLTIAERCAAMLGGCGLFLCGLIGIAIYMAIPAIYAAHSGVKDAVDIFWCAGLYGASLSFFTVIMPVLTVSYLRFKNGE